MGDAMSKPAFTPGPWREKKGDGVIYEISRPYKIATVGTGGKCTAEYRANIALVAAAPDMYEALTMIAEAEPIWNGGVAKRNADQWRELYSELKTIARAILSKVQP